MAHGPRSTLSTLSTSREDLEDLLADQSYFQAIFHNLSRVKALYQAQAELTAANETIASSSVSPQRCLYDDVAS